MPTARQLNVRHGLRVGGKSLADGSGILADVGDISTLSTTNKTSIVAAVNEVKGNFTNIDTADVAEDPSYLYFTNARARQSISVTDSGGDGSLSYDNVSGVLTFTGPSASEVRAHFSGGTGVTITNGTVAIGQPVSTSSSVTFANTTLTGVLYGPSQFVIDPAAQGDNTGEVIILGDLTVQGTTTTINSTTVEVEDKSIVLAKSATNSLQADGAGISIGGSNASVLYAALTDSWNFNLTVKGADGNESSPAYSFVSDPGLGLYRSADNQLSIATNSLERLRISDTTATLVGSLDLVLNRGTYSGTVTTSTLTGSRVYTLPDVSGTLVTTGDTGTVNSAMIANGTIVNEDINASAGIVDTKLATISTSNKVSLSSLDIDDGTDIGASLADSDLFIVDDGGAGTNRKAAATRITDYVFGKVSGDITITSTGTSAISNGVIVDADVSATAEIAVSKLADGTARQLLQTDAAGTGVEWTDNIDVQGTLDVTGNAVFDNRVTINGTDITESARDIEESRLIRRNATMSIGVAGTVPFGVGPVIPPGMSLVGIGPDSYNVIDIYSGSVC